MFVLQERKYHGRQITLSRKVFRYLFYRKANIRVDVTEDVLAFGIVLHKFFTEEETAMNYTYIVQCADGTLYTGWTNCLARRMKAHNEGKSGAKYTRAKRPVKIKQVGKSAAGIPTCFIFVISEIHELCRLLEDRRTAAEEMLVAVFT